MNAGARNVMLLAGGAVLVVAVLGAYALHRAPTGEADVRIIAHGERVDLERHTVPGKYTVFDFYAVWCPPCRALSPALEKLAARNPGTLAIRKVDIVDWTMPVAEQHGIEELPFLVLFDKAGNRLADGEKVFDELNTLYGDAALDVGRATEKPAATSM
ncbi:MAG TPA: thioredoxin family protein [Candidatus Polarisedimenticolia bacterium]|jgi:thiol-disulfide isomerase/thioredoxin|nr:thioredoxin family protein [Candidatus Polarisedimenticolia bacterium]